MQVQMHVDMVGKTWAGGKFCDPIWEKYGNNTINKTSVLYCDVHWQFVESNHAGGWFDRHFVPPGAQAGPLKEIKRKLRSGGYKHISQWDICNTCVSYVLLTPWKCLCTWSFRPWVGTKWLESNAIVVQLMKLLHLSGGICDGSAQWWQEEHSRVWLSHTFPGCRKKSKSSNATTPLKETFSWIPKQTEAKCLNFFSHLFNSFNCSIIFSVNLILVKCCFKAHKDVIPGGEILNPLFCFTFCRKTIKCKDILCKKKKK